MSGSVRMVGPGTARVQVYVGRDRFGKRKHRARNFPADGIADARRKAGEIVEQLRAQIDAEVAERGTMGELADDWLAIKSRHCAATTVSGYASIVAAIKAQFGKMPVSAINGRLIDAWYAKLEKGGMSANTVGHYHAVLRGMLRQAEKWELVGKVATRQSTPPPATPTEVIPPTTLALTVLLDRAGGELAVMLRALAATGMRRGEVLALARTDIVGTQVRIWRSIAEVAGRPPIVKTTKGKRSRTIVIDDATAALLRDHNETVDQQAADIGARIPADGWLFPDLVADVTGKTPHAPSWLSHRWEVLRGDASTKLHDVRHWHATMLIEAGVPITVVSERLGHAQVSTTMNIYAHALKARDDRAAAVMGGLLTPSIAPAIGAAPATTQPRRRPATLIGRRAR